MKTPPSQQRQEEIMEKVRAAKNAKNGHIIYAGSDLRAICQFCEWQHAELERKDKLLKSMKEWGCNSGEENCECELCHTIADAITPPPIPFPTE